MKKSNNKTQSKYVQLLTKEPEMHLLELFHQLVVNKADLFVLENIALKNCISLEEVVLVKKEYRFKRKYINRILSKILGELREPSLLN